MAVSADVKNRTGAAVAPARLQVSTTDEQVSSNRTLSKKQHVPANTGRIVLVHRALSHRQAKSVRASINHLEFPNCQSYTPVLPENSYSSKRPAWI